MNRVIPALAAAVALVFALSQPAAAAPPGGQGDSGASSRAAVGIDASWPQCGQTLPTGQAFGIVGVNGGLATTTNPCLSDQLRWAAGSTGASAQTKVQLYVNTANPGAVSPRPPSWPTSGSTPYGACDGGNSLACAWQYGWDRASDDMAQRLAPAADTAGLSSAASSYLWWLDVETGNTWQSDTASNRADLEGMKAAFIHSGATVGIYSAPSMWKAIAGTIGSSGPLAGLDSWIPGARTLSAAQRNCALAPLVPGGRVALTQYTTSLDYNYSCTG